MSFFSGSVKNAILVCDKHDVDLWIERNMPEECRSYLSTFGNMEAEELFMDFLVDVEDYSMIGKEVMSECIGIIGQTLGMTEASSKHLPRGYWGYYPIFLGTSSMPVGSYKTAIGCTMSKIQEGRGSSESNCTYDIKSLSGNFRLISRGSMNAVINNRGKRTHVYRSEHTEYLIYRLLFRFACNTYASCQPKFKRAYDALDSLMVLLRPTPTRLAFMSVLNELIECTYEPNHEYVSLQVVFSETYNTCNNLDGMEYDDLKGTSGACRIRAQELVDYIISGDLPTDRYMWSDFEIALWEVFQAVKEGGPMVSSQMFQLTKLHGVAECDPVLAATMYAKKTHYPRNADLRENTRVPCAVLKQMLFQSRAGMRSAESCLIGDSSTTDNDRENAIRILTRKSVPDKDEVALLERFRIVDYVQKPRSLNCIDFTNDKSCVSARVTSVGSIIKNVTHELTERLDSSPYKTVDEAAREINTRVKMSLGRGVMNPMDSEVKILTLDELHQRVRETLICSKGTLKEMEAKMEGRMFHSGHIFLKDANSFVQEVSKGVLKCVDTQIMTLSGDGRTEAVNDLAKFLNSDPKLRSIMVDFSSHNASFCGDLVSPFWDIILDAVGYPREEYSLLPYLYEHLDIVFPLGNGTYYHSAGQRGAIEGWHAYLWCVITCTLLRVVTHQVKYATHYMKMLVYNDDLALIMRENHSDRSTISESILLDLTSYLSSGFNLTIKAKQTRIYSKTLILLKNVFTAGGALEASLKNLGRINISTRDSYLMMSNVGELLVSSYTNYLLNVSCIPAGREVYSTLSCLLVLADFLMNKSDVRAEKDRSRGTAESGWEGVHQFGQELQRMSMRWIGERISSMMASRVRTMRKVIRGKSLLDADYRDVLMECTAQLSNELKNDISNSPHLLAMRAYGLKTNGGLGLLHERFLVSTGCSNLHVKAILCLSRWPSCMERMICLYSDTMVISGARKQEEVDLLRSEYVSQASLTSAETTLKRIIEKKIKNATGYLAVALTPGPNVEKRLLEANRHHMYFRLANRGLNCTSVVVIQEILAKFVNSSNLLSASEVEILRAKAVAVNKQGYEMIQMLAEGEVSLVFDRSLTVQSILDLLKQKCFPNITFKFTSEPVAEEIFEETQELDNSDLTISMGISNLLTPAPQLASTVREKFEVIMREGELSKKARAIEDALRLTNWTIRDDFDMMDRELSSLKPYSYASEVMSAVLESWEEPLGVPIPVMTASLTPAGGEIAHRVEYSGQKETTRSLADSKYSRTVNFTRHNNLLARLGGHNSNVNWNTVLFQLRNERLLYSFPGNDLYFKMRPEAELITEDVSNVKFFFPCCPPHSSPIYNLVMDYKEVDVMERLSLVTASTTAHGFKPISLDRCVLLQPQPYSLISTWKDEMITELIRKWSTASQEEIASWCLSRCRISMVPIPVVLDDEGSVSIDAGLIYSWIRSFVYSIPEMKFCRLTGATEEELVDRLSEDEFIGIAVAMGNILSDMEDEDKMLLRSGLTSKRLKVSLDDVNSYDITCLSKYEEVRLRSKIGVSMESFARVLKIVNMCYYPSLVQRSKSRSGVCGSYRSFLVHLAKTVGGEVGVLTLMGGRNEIGLAIESANTMFGCEVDITGLTLIRSDGYTKDKVNEVGHYVDMGPDFDVALIDVQVVKEYWYSHLGSRKLTHVFLEYSFTDGDPGDVLLSSIRLAREVHADLIVRVGSGFDLAYAKYLARSTSAYYVLERNPSGYPFSAVDVLFDGNDAIDPYVYMRFRVDDQTQTRLKLKLLRDEESPDMKELQKKYSLAIKEMNNKSNETAKYFDSFISTLEFPSPDPELRKISHTLLKKDKNKETGSFSQCLEEAGEIVNSEDYDEEKGVLRLMSEAGRTSLIVLVIHWARWSKLARDSCVSAVRVLSGAGVSFHEMGTLGVKTLTQSRPSSQDMLRAVALLPDGDFVVMSERETWGDFLADLGTMRYLNRAYKHRCFSRIAASFFNKLGAQNMSRMKIMFEKSREGRSVIGKAKETNETTLNLSSDTPPSEVVPHSEDSESHIVEPGLPSDEMEGFSDSLFSSYDDGQLDMEEEEEAINSEKIRKYADNQNLEDKDALDDFEKGNIDILD